MQSTSFLGLSLILFGLSVVSHAGKIMIWMPIGSKSMKITYIPLAEELGKERDNLHTIM
jgi:hypothetical protein